MAKSKPSSSDSEDLLIAVEDAFGLSIPVNDARVLGTVGELYDYILLHRFQGTAEGCVANVAFYKLRRALMSVFGLTRSSVHLSMDVAQLMPTRRRERWSQLQRALGLRLPELVRPLWVKVVATVIGLALIAGMFFVCGKAIGPGATWVALPVIIIAVPRLLFHMTKPLAIALRREDATVAALTKSILWRNYGTLSDECQRTNPHEVWNTLRAIIAEILGVSPDQLSRDMDFVRDLGVD